MNVQPPDPPPTLTQASIDAVGILFLRQEPVFDDPFAYVPTPKLDSPGALVPWPETVHQKLVNFWRPSKRGIDDVEPAAMVMAQATIEPPLIDWGLVFKYMGEMLAFFGTMFLVGWVVSPALSQRLWRGA